ncbi:hypothetical protein [Rickettsiella massiliensis]|uniref:hypothetical protein n=1 Tax=Rickettsiella massiliensis TaxID=676517 RepID=UPI0012EAD937|nr:hypothetical protein [Rickettsiella massiliensis]
MCASTSAIPPVTELQNDCPVLRATLRKPLPANTVSISSLSKDNPMQIFASFESSFLEARDSRYANSSASFSKNTSLR